MKRNRKLNIAAAFLLGSAMLLTPGWIAWVDRAEGASDKEVIAKELATLFRSARGVISKNQKLINDKNKGDKGLSGKNVIEVAKQNYKKATHKDLGNPDPNTLQGELMQTMLRSIGEVMDKAQPLINRKGMGFKGFFRRSLPSSLPTPSERMPMERRVSSSPRPRFTCATGPTPPTPGRPR